MQQTVLIRDTGVKVTDILGYIARGRSYEQILASHPRLLLGDIMAAAQLAQQFMEQYVTSEDAIMLDHVIELRTAGNRIVNVTKVREEFPRAFMPWKAEEEARLAEHFKRGGKVEDLAKAHQRNPGAIRSRLVKLGLLTSSGRHPPEPDRSPP